jgi:flagellar biosynthesis/type III secretory pathway protein FliH
MSGSAHTSSFANPVSAKRMPRMDFDRATECVASAEREAARIIADARAVAEGMGHRARDRAAALDQRALALDDAAFRQSLDHENATRRAAAMADVLDEAARMRAAFADATPWLTDLVQTCLRKIIGTMDKAEVIAAVVGEAVGEMNARHALVMRVAPADVADMQGIIAGHPQRFVAISAVVPDAALTTGTILLEGQGGFVAIGIAAQLAVLAGHLANLMPDIGRRE